jgi:hypothetical protein
MLNPTTTGNVVAGFQHATSSFALEYLGIITNAKVLVNWSMYVDVPSAIDPYVVVAINGTPYLLSRTRLDDTGLQTVSGSTILLFINNGDIIDLRCYVSSGSPSGTVYSASIVCTTV